MTVTVTGRLTVRFSWGLVKGRLGKRGYDTSMQMDPLWIFVKGMFVSDVVLSFSCQSCGDSKKLERDGCSFGALRVDFSSGVGLEIGIWLFLSFDYKMGLYSK